MTAVLTKYDFFLLLDKSGSMSSTDCPGGKSRWQYAQEATEALARKAQEMDDDGLTVIPFARSFTVYDGVTADKVSQIFNENEPSGGTDTAGVLKHVLDEYFSKKSSGAKPRIILVITDGAPDDKDAVKRVIINAANQCEDNGEGDTDELGISFIQVGGDPGARAFLQELDDQLQSAGAKFDIVDTKTLDEMENLSLSEVLLQALTD